MPTTTIRPGGDSHHADRLPDEAVVAGAGHRRSSTWEYLRVPDRMRRACNCLATPAVVQASDPSSEPEVTVLRTFQWEVAL